ncbi:hypothetical protein GF322_02930 [Candidatus Dependentiae bacterium]|nr:hypothetical protein [Candidatus Dependentiae bacterium]
MQIFTILLSAFLTAFSAAIISYISIATMVGPWIAPLLVLFSSFLLRFRKIPEKTSKINEKIALIQTAGSVGGIIGMGIGFSLPTLYFLDPLIFNNWLSSPITFCLFITIICIISGSLGILLAKIFSDKFIKKEQLSFPVSQLIYKTIVSQSQEKQAKNMFFGFFISWIICFLRDGAFRFHGLLLRIYYIFPRIFGTEFAIATSPMLWAIGFIVGTKIVFPLLVGMLSKYFIIYPLNNHASFLPFSIFNPLKIQDLITAFCSGLVISELILGLSKYPIILYKHIKSFSLITFFNKYKNLKNILHEKFLNQTKKDNNLIGIQVIIAILFCSIFLYYLKFNFLAIAFLLITTMIFTYQLSYLSGKIGLVTFGRFATFIMIPMMLLFKLDFIQITFLCVFFNICAGAASDLLFDYKVGELCNIDFKKILQYQWLGLVITSLSIGFFLWLLFTTFQVGSPDLFAQRGKSRALLIMSLNFDWVIVLFGFFYGVILKRLKISPTMVFGGLLMPNNLTIGLIIGAVISKFTKNKENASPFWSGIFAGESMWIMFSILLKIFFR